jgi:hypothetical protein
VGCKLGSDSAKAALAERTSMTRNAHTQDLVIFFDLMEALGAKDGPRQLTWLPGLAKVAIFKQYGPAQHEPREIMGV